MILGDVIALGNHRVMCGDCTNPEDVAALMQASHAKLLFTSPPYSDIYEYAGNNLDPKHLAGFIPAFKPHADIIASTSASRSAITKSLRTGTNISVRLMNAG